MTDPVREALAELVKRIDKEKSMHSWGEWGELTKARAALAAQLAGEWVESTDVHGRRRAVFAPAQPAQAQPAGPEDMKHYDAIAANYRSAQPAQPLTDDQIRQLWIDSIKAHKDADAFVVGFARAVLRAAGIGEQA